MTRKSSWTIDDGVFRGGGLEVSPSGLRGAQKGVSICERDMIRLYAIGKGQNRSVWAGVHLPTFRLVAVKSTDVAHMSSRHQMINELRVLSTVKHPNILQLHGAYLADGHITITLEFMNGGSLAQRMQRQESTFSEASVAEIARQVLKGLVHLHSLKQVHGDIKPDNILVNSKGEVKLSDFGLSKSMGPAKEIASESGTLLYMSPEQHSRQLRSCASDIWSFGLTLLTLANGRPPYESKDYWALLDLITNKPSPTVSAERFSEGFKSFVDLCLHKDPKDRATAEELLAHPFLQLRAGGKILPQKNSNTDENQKQTENREQNQNALLRLNQEVSVHIEDVDALENVVARLFRGIQKMNFQMPPTPSDSPPSRLEWGMQMMTWEGDEEVKANHKAPPTDSKGSAIRDQKKSTREASTREASMLQKYAAGVTQESAKILAQISERVLDLAGAFTKMVLDTVIPAKPSLNKIGTAADITLDHLRCLMEQMGVCWSKEIDLMCRQHIVSSPPSILSPTVTIGSVTPGPASECSSRGRGQGSNVFMLSEIDSEWKVEGVREELVKLEEGLRGKGGGEDPWKSPRSSLSTVKSYARFLFCSCLPCWHWRWPEWCRLPRWCVPVWLCGREKADEEPVHQKLSAVGSPEPEQLTVVDDDLPVIS